MNSSGSPPSSTSRLPGYRSAHIARYHPYTMASRRQREDRLMNTVDYRGGLEPILEEPEVIHLRPLHLGGENPDADVSSLKLDDPTDNGGKDTPAAPISGSHKVAVAFVDMMFAVRRRYLALLAVAEFLKAKQTK